jgi:YHS domain-containing protein
MRKRHAIMLLIVLAGLILYGCAAQSQSSQYAICPVCNKTVEKDTDFTRRYKGVTYYFDKASCEVIFKKNAKQYTARKSNMSK